MHRYVTLTIQFNISHFFAHLKWFNSSIWPIDGTLTGSTSLGQNEPGSNGNERIFHIILSSRTGASPLDCLVSYPGHSLAGWGILLLCRDAIGVFYSPIQLNCHMNAILTLHYSRIYIVIKFGEFLIGDLELEIGRTDDSTWQTQRCLFLHEIFVVKMSTSYLVAI